MRSLMELLMKEEEIVDNIEYTDRCAAIHMGHLDRIKENPYECDAKRFEIKRCEEELSKLSNQVSAYRKDLEQTRDAIREYMQVLMNGETMASDV